MATLQQGILTFLGFRRVIGFVWKGAPGWTVLSGMLVLVQGTLPLLSLVLLKSSIDAVSLAAKHFSHAAIQHAVQQLILLGTIALITASLRSLSNLVSECQAQQVTDSMQDVLHAKSVEIDLSFYEQSRYYDTMHRAQSEAPYRPTRIVTNVVQISQSAISLGAIAALMLASIGWRFAVLLLIASIPGVIVKLMLSKQSFLWQKRRTATERRIQYFNWMLTGDAHAKELRLFGLGDHFSRLSRDLRRTLRRERLAITKRRSTAEIATQIGSVAALYGSFGYLAIQCAEGIYTLGALVMFFQAFQRGQSALQDLLSGISDLYEGNLFLANLFDFLDLKPMVHEPDSPVRFPKHIQTGIQFARVCFSYGKEANPVLNDVSFTIRAGETVAIVGENGSGKSTLIKLLCRLYDPTSGAITVDGIDIRDFSPVEYRKALSVVFQDFNHYYLPAKDNIWFGNVEAPFELDRIRHAATQSTADDVIMKLPQTYDTVLGYAYDEGHELSVGQWQKVAIARAFMRDAPVMILDEPTSALDARAESEVFDMFRELINGRTAVIISHRLSTVKMADHIYFLHDGRITEHGRHDELMDIEGMYASLYRTQANSYSLA
ncbi:MAG: ABC transporter ATP-binding protein [Capsulimonadaceae bacterium]